MAVAGLKYTKDATGRNRYLRIDLEKHGRNQLLDDFLDILDVEARTDEPAYPMEEVFARQDKKRGLV